MPSYGNKWKITANNHLLETEHNWMLWCCNVPVDLIIATGLAIGGGGGGGNIELG